MGALNCIVPVEYLFQGKVKHPTQKVNAQLEFDPHSQKPRMEFTRPIGV
jgi:hypothetical protein